MRATSKLAEGWWDYTTLDREILDAASRITIDTLKDWERPGFKINIYDNPQEFYSAEALEYVSAWKQATDDCPVAVCGPIGPTEQLPIVAQIVNAIGLNLKNCHFFGMDEWVIDGKAAPADFPMSFAKCDMDFCFNRIRPELRMPKENLHFPSENPEAYNKAWENVRCVLMQGGQGETKHWAFNDPVRREGKYADNPPTPEEYRKLSTRVVNLHPITLMQNARTSGGGMIQNVPSQAVTVGPVQTWKAERISIWHPGHHDNALGMRLTTYMLSKKIADSAVPMSLLSDHPDVTFSFLRSGFGVCDVEMH